MKGIFLFMFCFLFRPCTADYWTQKANVPSARAEAVGFSIGNYGYIATGADSVSPNDLWQYDPSANSWLIKASVPQSRTGAVGVSCSNKGYVGLGYSSGLLNDWWEYDPILNVWTQKNNFPGTPRQYASAFSIDSSIYVGCGQGPFGTRDWWNYNGVLNSWSPIDSIPSINQYGYWGGTSFSIQGKGYFIGGTPGGQQVFEYDPVLDVWNYKNLFPGFGRYGATGFAIGAFGYIGTGVNVQGPFLKDFWQYNILADQWIQKNDFGGMERATAIGFSINTKGYFGTGYDFGLFWLNDFWEYTPDSNTSTSEISYQQSEIILFPNPTKGKLSFLLPFGGNMHLAVNQIEIYNLFGKQVLTVTGWGLTTVDCGLLPPGIYIIQATSGEKIWRTKVVKE